MVSGVARCDLVTDTGSCFTAERTWRDEELIKATTLAHTFMFCWGENRYDSGGRGKIFYFSKTINTMF